MKKKFLGCLLLLTMMVGLLSGCGDSNKESRFKNYIQSVITANYLGTSDEYIKTTGANRTDAEALYLQNANRLANNLNAYYGLAISSDSELAPRMEEVAKQVYSRIRYDVAPARMENGIYYVDVTIYPINILNDTHDYVTEYVGRFNKKVSAGEYNDYTREEYRHEFAAGIIDILEEGAKKLTYRDPQTVTVRIIEGKDSYYISDDDFRAIDALVIATVADETAEPGEAPEPDDTPATTEQSWG